MLYKMKTAFEEIVSVEHIGKDENPFALGELLAKACAEELPRAAKDKTKRARCSYASTCSATS